MSILQAILGTGPSRRDLFYREGIPPVSETSWSGERIDQDSAVRMIAVYACVSLLADTVSTLPVGTYVKQGTTRLPDDDPDWLDMPVPTDPSLTRIDHLSQLMWSQGLDNNSFTLVLPDVSDPAELRVCNPNRVEVKSSRTGPRYTLTPDGGGREEVGPDQMVHISRARLGGTGRGVSPVSVASQSLATKRAAERLAAKVFGNGMFLSGQLLLPGPAQQEVIDQLRGEITEQYVGSDNAFKPGIFANGAKWDVPGINLAQFQLLEQNQNVTKEVARVYRIAPYLVGVTEPGAMANASVEAQGIEFEKFTIRPYIERIELAYRRLLGPGRYLKFDTKGLLRGDFKTRMEGYQVATGAKLMLPEEARALEDMPPIAPGAAYLETPNNSAPDPRYQSLARLISAGYDPTESLAALGLPPIKHIGLPPVTVQPESTP